MSSHLRHAFFSILAAALSGCAALTAESQRSITSISIDGATFEIADAAVYANCLSLDFSVSGYVPPPGRGLQTLFPIADTFAIRTPGASFVLDPIPMGGGGGGGGDQDDGRVWLREHMTFSLATQVPNDTRVPLDITVLLNQGFDHPEPLEFRMTVVASPGGGTCPLPETLTP